MNVTLAPIFSCCRLFRPSSLPSLSFFSKLRAASVQRRCFVLLGPLTGKSERKFPRLIVHSRIRGRSGNEGDIKVNIEEKPTLFQKFKSMYRDYWYVLIPVHVVTSLGWFAGFYYVATSGIDLVSLAESVHLSPSLTEKLKAGSKESLTGYLAIAYAMYKIATPLRYTVTLGGTTISINYLKKFGYIKPIPKKAELKKILDTKRENLKDQRKAISSFVIEKLSQKKE